MNTQENTVRQVAEVKIPLMQFGQGKYSQLASEYAFKSQSLFGFDDSQADRFGHQLMSDMGRLNLTAEKLKVGKPNKDMMVNISTAEKTESRVHETASLTLVAGINELEKAMARIPSLELGAHFKLPKYLQFNAKQTQ